MATHSSILAWEIPWTEEPGELQSMELQKSRIQLINETTTTELLDITFITTFLTVFFFFCNIFGWVDTSQMFPYLF